MPRTIRDLMPKDLEFQMFVLDELADDLIARGADVLKLTIGVSELAMPQIVLERMVDKLRNPEFVRRVYPEGLPELREAIAEFYNRRHGADVRAAHVIVNTGSSPIFRNIFQLLSGPDYEIMIPRPYYALYLYCAKLAGAKVKFYDIDIDTKRVDMDSFRRSFSPERTSLVVINSPGNPVGNIVNVDEMREIYEIVNRQAYILNDEIYNNTMFYEEFHSPLAVLPEQKDITIVTNSFSKGYRMYTKRIGFALLPEELQTNLRVIQQHTLLCTDPCYQDGMIAALGDEESPEELTNIYRSRAEYTTERLAGTGCEPIAAEGGFYAILRCAQWCTARGFSSSKELARDILNRAHVAVVPGTDFGVPNDLRLAFCNDRYNEGIDRLQSYFTSTVRDERPSVMQDTLVATAGAGG
ncbi:MAG: aminotransferase class I/II-fold pyridoxal phosphate-dependent enzyme [Proteobacteria bacterium]|nr:aminotransferase class I/II-fold pyridoxal phosphate-dependent enzyme [Pseudomonadota bacterium]